MSGPGIHTTVGSEAHIYIFNELLEGFTAIKWSPEDRASHKMTN